MKDCKRSTYSVRMKRMSVFAAPGAYDRAITVFSPDGRLFQVEYAMELVNRGATILGITCSEGVILGSEENVEPLEEAEYSWKLFKVDDHIGAAIVGLSSDARMLIDQARVYAQSNKLTYDEPIDVEVVTKRISDIKQMYTQHAGVRPFGVSIIFAGVDKTGSRIFYTHPSGTYRGYKATAVGAGRETALAILKDEYRENMSLDQTVKLAVKCLTKALEARQLPPRIKIAVIPSETKKMEMLADDKIEAMIKELGVGK
jgi:proteasome alpha subunit